jgi:OOP family OmpA-OmpF porin
MAANNKAVQADRGIAEGAEKPFDFNTVPEASGTIPPFPYVTTPPKLLKGFLWTEAVPMDRIFLILGDHLHAVEGRVTTRTFHNRTTEMSELEIRRNYENAMRAMGAVKVNTVAPNSPVLGSPEGDEYVARMRRLSMPQVTMAYDTYLARKGAAHNWLVVMVGDTETRLIAIEEQPFKQTINYVSENGKTLAVTATGAPPAAQQPVDIDGLPVSSAVLPPFPYLPYPPGILEGVQHTEHANFDAVQIIVGKQLRVVEGRLETRSFANRNVNMSEMALRRNYEAAVKGLGGIKVNATSPYELAEAANASGKPAPQHDKMRFPGESMSYDSYLVRTPEKNIWLVLMFNDSKTSLLAVEEKAMQQSVGLVTADDMRKELDAKGKIALYINFDTDKASLRPDGKPAIDEVTKLLKADPQLRLAIEGHTDDSGNVAHNQALSGQRAEAVLQTLVKDGIDAKRLRAAGRGATLPLADNKDDAGRAKNRRVELIKL